LSVILIVTLYEFWVVGAPDTTPLDASIVKPGGKPVADHVYGAVPPVRVIVVDVYGKPTCPSGSNGPEIARIALIVTGYVLVTTVVPPVRLTTTLYDPAAVGLGDPEITPPELMEIPAGRPVAAHVYGVVPPVPVIVVDEYVSPTCPSGKNEGAEIASGGGAMVIAA
jgi:hypothetical protein